ncbi:DUF58 domain-containing protein [Neisseria weaveri]|uniref:DUF58 domain-containing protein n=1 Tax=Neisseria weaveri TaxID=28091 RepID=UPI0007C9D564|nr:DUF58 domain-containing protein [Neisseria weaveri]SAY52037.1 Uncharacterized conserved protein (some members contain a von Willebrand factor type A (vWA) domain) [Neisseria weaveri]
MWPLRKRRLPAVAGRSPRVADLYCRPTRFGIGVLVVMVLLWLVGLQYQANLAYIAAFWLTGFLIAAVMLNFRQLLGLQIDVDMADEVFAGGTVALRLTVPENRRSRWIWLCGEAETPSAQGRPSENGWQLWQVGPDSNSDGPTDGGGFVWQLDAPLRGYIYAPPLRTASVAPFGICMVECVWRWPKRAVVFPKPIAHELPLQGHAEAGSERTDTADGSGDLSYLQAHQEGASLQHVAWKMYAKTGELLDKRFEEALAQVDETVISYADYPSEGSKERLAGLLCFRVLEAERRHLPYSLVLPDRTIAPQNGQREKCLTALALW